nr:hypothetical protein [Tanacetum cinerariifolium]
MDEEEVNKLNDLNINIIEEVTSKISCDAVMKNVANLDTIVEEVIVEGAYYDTIDDAIDMYTKYAEMAGFEIKKGGQRLTKSGAVQHSMKGGYEYVYGTTDDFKNHQRDVNVFIGESYAQMLINKMENKKMYVPNFTFQYRVENNELVAMFEADEVAKCNYKEFEDIVSFDATFNSNKYNMKFVPFIGIDNHGKCVTLGSRMLLHDDTKSYMWLLNAFMTAFSHEPIIIVTDQDEAMKRAIEAIFKKTGSHEIHSDSHEIQSESYEIRQDLMTTSRPESENSFFKSFTSPGETLVSFMMLYKSAMERQGHRQETLDFKTIDAASKCETMLEIKRHATRVYTMMIFLLVQKEIIEDMPNPPSRNTGDAIGGIFSITKPNQIAVQNPTKAVNKGEHLKKEEHLKSEREKPLKVGKKKIMGLWLL